MLETVLISIVLGFLGANLAGMWIFGTSYGNLLWPIHKKQMAFHLGIDSDELTPYKEGEDLDFLITSLEKESKIYKLTRCIFCLSFHITWALGVCAIIGGYASFCDILLSLPVAFFFSKY